MATVWQNSMPSITLPDNVNNKQIIYLYPQADIRGLHEPEVNRSIPKNVSQPFSNISISNNLNAGFSSMKKGLSTLVTSLDSALKANPDDMSDTISIRSDASSDSEKFVMVPTDEKIAESSDDMFFVLDFCYECKGSVEIASEVVEEDSSVTSTSDHSLGSSCKRKDLVRFL